MIWHSFVCFSSPLFTVIYHTLGILPLSLLFPTHPASFGFADTSTLTSSNTSSDSTPAARLTTNWRCCLAQNQLEVDAKMHNRLFMFSKTYCVWYDCMVLMHICNISLSQGCLVGGQKWVDVDGVEEGQETRLETTFGSFNATTMFYARNPVKSRKIIIFIQYQDRRLRSELRVR